MATERNPNYVPVMLTKSNAADNADVILWGDPSTHRLLVDVSGGGISVAATDDAAFVAGTGTGTPFMGFATADLVDSGDVGVIAMTTARAMHVYIKGSDVAAGGTSMVDDAAFTPAVTSGTPMFGTFDDVAPDSVDEGDGGAVRMSANRNLYVRIRDNAGNERGLNIDASGQIAVTLAAAQTLATVTTLTGTTTLTPGTAATNLGKAEDAVHASGDTGVFMLAVGNEAQSTLAADGDYIAHGVDTKGNSLVVGNLAADAVDAGFPVKVGGQARTTNPTAVADADRSNFITDKLGKQVVVGSIRDLKTQQITTITTSTAETTVLTAVGSTFLDVYGVIVVNSSATASNISFKDSTSGTTRFNIYVPAGETRGFMLPESAAVNQATVNNNWTATSSASVTSIIITMLAVKNI